MAKINPIHGEMSGSIAGNTYSHNKGGQYVRQRRVPVNPTSARQTAVRTILGTLSSAWSGLTEAQRTNWGAWAALNPVIDTLGLSITLSGEQAYVGLNARLIDSGETPSDDPPSGTGPTTLITTTTTPTTPDSISVAFATSPLPAGQKMVVRMTPPGSVGRDPNFNQSRQVGFSDAADTTPVVFTTPFGFVTGDAFNLYVAVMDASGRITPYQKERVIVP